MIWSVLFRAHGGAVNGGCGDRGRRARRGVGMGRAAVPAIGASYAAESDRRILWLPVFFGSGIALYFALTVEPPLWLGPAIAGAAWLAAWLLRRLPVWRSAALCLAIGAAGLALITATARERPAPMLDRRLGPVAFTGRVIDIDTLDRGWRIIVAPDALPGLARPSSRIACASTSPRRATC